MSCVSADKQIRLRLTLMLVQARSASGGQGGSASIRAGAGSGARGRAAPCTRIGVDKGQAAYLRLCRHSEEGFKSTDPATKGDSWQRCWWW